MSDEEDDFYDPDTARAIRNLVAEKTKGQKDCWCTQNTICKPCQGNM